jgi:hypothetical protein
MAVALTDWTHVRVEGCRPFTDAMDMRSHRRLVAFISTAALLVWVGIALAKAPDVLYQQPTDVTETGATLHGSVNPNDKSGTYHFEYGTSTAYGASTADVSLPKSKTWQTVSAAVTDLSPGTTYHYRLVALNGGGASDKTYGGDHTFTTVSAPDTPGDPGSGGGGGEPGGGSAPSGGGGDAGASSLAPSLGSSVVVDGDRGTVLVRRPGSHRFVRLTAGAELPVGSVIDANDASLALTSALPSGRTQTGHFGGGRFQVRQGRQGYVDLYLRGPRCAHATSQIAMASRRRRPNGLWGRDHGGRFRTHGRNSQATVRGTRWLVQDRCDGTLTRVTQGAVVVSDTVRHRRIVLHAGQRYLARDR